MRFWLESAVLAQIRLISVEGHILPLVLGDVVCFSQGNLQRKQMHTFPGSVTEATLPDMPNGYVGDSTTKREGQNSDFESKRYGWKTEVV